jgi:predicted enzyme related to lactoylglutathione lyase
MLGDMTSIPEKPRVTELRLVVTADDYDEALRFYRDVLGLPQGAEFTSGEGGRVAILGAGRATIELANPAHAAYVDEVEVGHRVAGHLRVAFSVEDTAASTELLAQAGAEVVAPATTTPWGSSNARLDAPGGLHITLFSQEADPFED